MRSHIRLVLLLTTILIGLIALMGVLIATRPNAPLIATDNGTPIAAPGFSGDFTLMDENGTAVTQATYADRYKLIFFGFTHCPSICPTELLKMADILAALPPKTAERLAPLFITVDPSRDTPTVLKTYTDNFDPRIVGLTGTEPQVKSAIAAFKIYAARVDTGGGDYTMDHSTFLYFIGPDGALIKLFRMEETAPQIAATLKDIIK